MSDRKFIIVDSYVEQYGTYDSVVTKKILPVDRIVEAYVSDVTIEQLQKDEEIKGLSPDAGGVVINIFVEIAGDTVEHIVFDTSIDAFYNKL